MAPLRTYENYVFYRDELSPRAGLMPVPREKFVRIISGNVTSSSPTASVVVTLGFEFPAENGLKYTRAAVSHGGAMVLIDPSQALTVPASAFTPVVSSLTDNKTVRSTFSSASLLLCPWWDPNQATIASDVYELTKSWTEDNFRIFRYGLIRPEDVFGSNGGQSRHAEQDGGVLYAQEFWSDSGRCSVVRWCTRETTPDTSRLLRYEAALFENGTVEFRYATPQQPPFTSSFTSSAVIGAFFPSGTLRFRDMSALGGRQAYELGGYAYTSSYSDRGAAYCVSNAGHAGWPGALAGQATYTFKPSVSLRDVLPKIKIKQRSNQSFTPLFNDRRSVPALSGALDAPLSLSYLDVDGDGADRSDLFRIQTHAVRNRRVDDIALLERPVKLNSPFSDNIIDDPLLSYASASSIDVNVPNYTTRLQSRQSIDYAFRINRQSKFLPVLSSLMLFDVNAGMFVAAGLTNVISPADEQRRAAENGSGFNAVGCFIASGAYSISSQSQSTLSPGLYSQSSLTQSDLLTAFYDASMTVSDNYLAWSGRVRYDPIRVNIKRPFAVEAIELELPIKANDAWFRDLTTVRVNNPSSSFAGWNLGGPGMTVAIMVDRGGPLRKYRDIIATGSITHLADATTVSYTVTPLGANNAIVSPIGFKTCGGDPAGIVNATSGSSYTGSVKLFMPAATAVGSFMAVTGSTAPATFLQTLPSSTTLPKATLAHGWANAIPVHLTPFGRSHDGTSVSARSFVSREASIDKSIRHRFTLTGSALSALSASISAYSSVTYAGTAYNVTNAAAPYILLPNDGLRIQIAKSRPAVTGAGPMTGSSATSIMDSESLYGVFGITEGEMRLRLIGRYIRSGELTELYDSESAEEIVGSEPIVDQLEFLTRQELFGTTHDDYVTGSYVNRGLSGLTVSGERARVFSIANASSSQRFDTSTYSVAITPPTWIAGSNDKSVAYCESERLYDSMLPPIDQITKRNGGSVFYQPAGFYIVNKPTAIIFYDVPTQHTASIATYADNIWSRAFPFESRYASLQRMTDITRFFNCDLKLANGTLGDIQSLTNDGVADNLVVIRTPWLNERSGAGSPAQANLYFFYALDAVGNNPPKVITAPVTNTFQTKSDLVKTLYGIGSMNSVMITGSSAPMGSTCAPDYAGYSYDPPSSRQYIFGAKPIIRGWKYGLASGLREVSRAVWRRSKFGQMRDMLEQRVMTKFASEADGSVSGAPVRVTFVDSFTRSVMSPDDSSSSNISYEATSSLPYFDGAVRNR